MSEAARFSVSEVQLAVHKGGQGPTIIFQHGLCGNAAQPRELLPDNSGFTRLTLECRGHGASETGPHEQLSIAAFADDLIAFIESQKLGPVDLAGVSMGAAIALRIAALRPGLVKRLILVRPAWLTEAAPDNLEPNRLVGRLLNAHTPEEALQQFESDPLARDLSLRSPDNLASLRGFFTVQDPRRTAELLTRIAADGDTSAYRNCKPGAGDWLRR
jgi:pimeloyl-ACP methyl ester carboxylesterase